MKTMSTEEPDSKTENCPSLENVNQNNKFIKRTKKSAESSTQIIQSKKSIGCWPWPSSKRKQKTGATRKSKKVLIFDDDMGLTEFELRQLRGASYETELETRGDEQTDKPERRGALWPTLKNNAKKALNSTAGAPFNPLTVKKFDYFEPQSPFYTYPEEEFETEVEGKISEPLDKDKEYKGIKTMQLYEQRLNTLFPENNNRLRFCSPCCPFASYMMSTFLCIPRSRYDRFELDRKFSEHSIISTIEGSLVTTSAQMRYCKERPYYMSHHKHARPLNSFSNDHTTVALEAQIKSKSKKRGSGGKKPSKNKHQQGKDLIRKYVDGMSDSQNQENTLTRDWTPGIFSNPSKPDLTKARSTTSLLKTESKTNQKAGVSASSHSMRIVP